MDPWVGKIPWMRAWQPTTVTTAPIFLPGKSHGQRSLASCSPWGIKESDTTEHAHMHVILDWGERKQIFCPGRTWPSSYTSLSKVQLSRVPNRDFPGPWECLCPTVYLLSSWLLSLIINAALLVTPEELQDFSFLGGFKPNKFLPSLIAQNSSFCLLNRCSWLNLPFHLLFLSYELAHAMRGKEA